MTRFTTITASDDLERLTAEGRERSNRALRLIAEVADAIGCATTVQCIVVPRSAEPDHWILVGTCQAFLTSRWWEKIEPMNADLRTRGAAEVVIANLIFMQAGIGAGAEVVDGRKYFAFSGTPKALKAPAGRDFIRAFISDR